MLLTTRLFVSKYAFAYIYMDLSFLADVLCSVKMFNADKDCPHPSEMLPLQRECLEKSYSSSFKLILLAYKSLCHHATKHTKLVAQAT